ncbi:hypothetical protein N665_1712s0004 [Sinapis alba]|nr:hypothetical protein N665_1712s0004 [Sinapis alba]
MAPSSGMRKYPPRLYEAGKTPIQNRSMNHSCFLSNIQMVKENLREDVWSALRESAIGVIVKLKELDYIWSAKVVHYFLANQLAIESSHEIWSLIDCMPLRFSLYEFGEITGLNCDPFDKSEVWDVDHQEFWLEMKVPTSDGPTLKELQALFSVCRNWPLEKRVMVGLLCLLSIGIFDISSNSRIPLHCAKRVLDTAAFQRYPWGRVGFCSLVESIKVLTYEGKKSYTLHGCVHVLLICIYESVIGVGEIYGNRIEGADVPLLSWHGSRTRINFSDFCAQEKREHQKIRVRHLIMKPVEDIYPKWNNDTIYTDLDNMIKDILNGQLNEKFWDAMPATKFEKRKYGVAASVVPNVSPSSKRRKDTEPADVGEASDMVAAHNVAILGLASTLEEPTRRRKPTLTKTQVWSYVGNSTVRRIITAEKVSKQPYDPLAKVEAEKLHKVLDFIKSDMEAKEPGSGDESAAAMLMFYRRSMQEQSPYSSSRIAFLSRWFVNSWVNDYKKWEKNTNELSELYNKAFDGEHPADFVMGKKWVVDVDDLFLCHHVNGDHWVALHIDLPKEVIHVYDSIHTHLSDKQMIDECRPFMRIIPTVLNKMLPAKMRKKSDKQFTCRRHKKIPKMRT